MGTALLYQTGEQSPHFIMILSTNRPGDLDSAVVDRIDETLQFGLPTLEQRTRLASMYYKKHVLDLSDGKASQDEAKDAKAQQVDDNTHAQVAEQTNGFSGREIAKLMTSVRNASLLTAATGGGGAVSKKLLMDVVDRKVKEHHHVQGIL